MDALGQDSYSRRFLLGRALAATAGLALASCLEGSGRSPPRIPWVGLMVAGPDAQITQPVDAAFREGLRAYGYAPGETVRVETRHQTGRSSDWDDFAAEFVAMPVDVIVVPHMNALAAAARATKTVPIVAIIEQDPTDTAYVESLARPGGRITGITAPWRDLGAKLLELLRELAPSARHIAILRGGPYAVIPGAGGSEARIAVHRAAAALGFEVFDAVFHDDPEDLPFRLRHLTRLGVDALIVPAYQTYPTRFRREIADYAIERRIPIAADQEEWAEAGGLVALGVDRRAAFRRLAYFVGRILKGTKPAQLPMEQPVNLELILNLRTAAALDISISPSLLGRATRVIQ